MSSVLRPHQLTKSTSIEKEDVVVPVIVPVVIPAKSLHEESFVPKEIKNDMVNTHEAVEIKKTETVGGEVKPKEIETVQEEKIEGKGEGLLAREDSSKDEIISEALQKLLDRKIDKVLTEAETSLEVLESSHSTAKKVDGIAASDMPMQNSNKVEVNTVNQVYPLEVTEIRETQIETTPLARQNLGQEIKIQKLVVTIPEIFTPPVASVATAPVQVAITPSVQLTHQEPVVEVTATVAPSTPKIVGWFDKLFGSA